MTVATPQASDVERRKGAPEVHRILVALDNSGSSLRALGAATEMARTMQAEIEGLFIEDEELVRLAGLPFSSQIGSACGGELSLDIQAVERQFRLFAGQAEAALAKAAAAAGVPWRFTVQRGVVRELLTSPAISGDIVSLGHRGWCGGRRRQLGSSVRAVLEKCHRSVLLLPDQQVPASPLVLVYDGSDGAERALAFAARLLASRPVDSVVILVPDQREVIEMAKRVEALFKELQITPRYVEVRSHDHRALADAISAVRPGLCVFSAESEWVRSTVFRKLLLDIPFATLLVR